MKNLIFFATLLIFILNISDNVVSSAKDEVPDPVLDVDGDELEAGTSYYITSVFLGGGGVAIYPTAKRNCSYAVVQLVLGDGLPVTFAYGGTDLGEVVRESTDIMISFSPGMFLFPTVWKVDDYDEATKQYFVTADYNGRPTRINIWFQIQKDPFGSYKFVFCPQPKVCEFCAQICTNVSIFIDGGVRCFALDGNFPFTFKFKKMFQPCANSNALEA